MPPAAVGAKTKICSHCRLRKRLSEFSPHAGRPDGLQSQCKACRTDWAYSKRQRTGYEYERWYNRAKSRALQRLMEAHPDEFEDLFSEALSVE